jgi:hypothetical protein
MATCHMTYSVSVSMESGANAFVVAMGFFLKSGLETGKALPSVSSWGFLSRSAASLGMT